MLPRRHFLRAAGVTLALPWLESLASGATAPPRRRMVCICTPLGVHSPYFFPENAGRDYTPSVYLEPFKDMRGDFSIISGLSHPEVGPSHDSVRSFLTAAPHPELRAGFRNTISLDQLAAQNLAGETRFNTLVVGCEGQGLSYTRSGAPVPAEAFPQSVFAKLFLQGGADEVEAQARRLRDGQSVLDTVLGQTKRILPKLGDSDRDKLDEYFSSVRDLERQLAQAEQWSKQPKPKVDAQPPRNGASSTDLIGKTKDWLDLIHLALLTDSTRLVTLNLLGTSGVPPVAGVSLGHHDLSHHGKDPAKIDQLKKIELEEMKALADFLKKLKDTHEEGESLLDRTIVYFSSNLGNASNHAVKNLPVLLAGGGFRHGQHLAFNPDRPPPLSNLYVSMLQRLGVEADKFGSSTGTLTGLELV